MRILFISGELIGSAIIHRLIQEGSEVKLYIEHEDRKDCFEGIANKVEDWKSEIDWVGKDGLIVFDDVMFGKEKDQLRRKSYNVIGGNSISDKLEVDRQFFHDVLKKNDIPVLPSLDFENAAAAERYVRENRSTWVVKQNSHLGILNYVGQRDDAEDVLDILQMYKEKGIAPVHIQRKVTGVEIGVARYFNGHDWIGPIEVNLEHKSLCNEGIGPLTAEMGTLLWYHEDERFSIYNATLARMKDYLRQIDFRGDIDINCIVNKEGIWPLEATMRFGTPSTEVHCELHKSPWCDFMSAIAKGIQYDLKYKHGYGIAISVAVPPFPYGPENYRNSNIDTSQGVRIFFKEKLSEKEMSQIHFEEVSRIENSDNNKNYYIAGKHGYTLYVTGHGNTVDLARRDAYSVVEKIVIPRMFYRTDIGKKFIEKEQSLLKKWGYLGSSDRTRYRFY